MPNTKDLIDMSRILTSDWKMFVREIDVPDSEIDAIVEKYKLEQPWEQKYQCLCYWLDAKGEQASFKQLMDAARKSGQVKLANYVAEDILKGVLSITVYTSLAIYVHSACKAVVCLSVTYGMQLRIT